MAINPYESQPLQTPVTTKRKISAIGKGKVTWITWKNALLAFLWLLLTAFISFLTFPAEMWIKGVVFACTAVPGLCFFLIPIPGKDYYWVYNFVFDSIRFFFTRSANTMPNLGATSEFIPFDYIKGHKLFYKGSTVQAFFRLNGRNIYSCSEEIQSELLNSYHTLLKNLHNTTVKIVSFACNFKLKENANFWNNVIHDPEDKYLSTALLPLSVLEHQNWQFLNNFPFYKDRREHLYMSPAPRDMAYFLVITADSEQVTDLLSDLILSNLGSLDHTFIEPATPDDLLMYIRKNFGLTSVDYIRGYDVKEDAKGETIWKFNELFSNMHSMVFEPKYWKTVDWKTGNAVSKVHYHKIIAIQSFKTDADLGWMDPLFEDPSVDCIQIKVENIPLDKQAKLIGKAINQYTKVEKGSANAGSFASAKLEDTFHFLKDLEQNANKSSLSLVKTTIYLKLSATSLNELHKKEVYMKSEFKKTLGLDKKCYDGLWFRQRDALLASLGAINDKLSKKIGMNLLSSALALGWPFNNPRIIQSSGFHLGFTSNGKCPVCLDIVGETSLSGMIVGKTGSGKSVLAKLLSLNILTNKRNKIFWFDPENEMYNFGNNFNGNHIDLTSTTPTITKIEFNVLKNSFLNENGTWTEERFLFAYIALLDLAKSYRYLYGLENEKILEAMRSGDPEKYKRAAKSIKEIVLINETMDYFGLGSLEKHSKLVTVANSEIYPELVKIQILNLKKEVQNIVKLYDPLDIYIVYNYIYKKCVHQSNINPYRIMIKSQTDLDSLNAFGLYNQHKQMLLTWFKQLMPKADVIATTWFNNTLDTLYLERLNLTVEKQDNKQVDLQPITNKSTKQILEQEEYPTIQQHYEIMLREFNKLRTTKHPVEQTSDIKKTIKVYNDVLSVFDNLVENNRWGKRGMFYYLWNKDNKLDFAQNNKLAIFNIQNLLSNVKNIKENNYTDSIKFDFQNIFNAQYYLSQQIIWSFVVNNRINNAKQKLKPQDQEHVFIFMDEAHASLKQPQFVDWSVNLIKRARKYQSGLWLITQSIGDYMALDDASELFNNFMFKFYFQSEAQAFDDIVKKFKISRVPLTVSEERWLNPLLGNTVKGRCILTFEDGKRYMMTVCISNNFLVSLLEDPIISSKPYETTRYNPLDKTSYGIGILGWLNYLRSNEQQLKAAQTDKILFKAYRTWLDNNLKKHDYNKWYKKRLERRKLLQEQRQTLKKVRQSDFEKSYDKSKKEKIDRK